MNGWSVVYDHYEPDAERHREAICTLGNGYFATRGASTDCSASPGHYPGTYLAGTYNRATSEIAGERIENEDLVNWPNWLVLRMRPQGEDWLSVDDADLLEYRQELCLRDGVLYRSIRFRHGDGRITRWNERRLVGMHDPHLAALSVRITPENWSGTVTICSAIDGSVRNTGVERYRNLASRHLHCVSTTELTEDTIQLVSRTTQSRIEVAQTARTRAYRDGDRVAVSVRSEIREDWIGQHLDFEVEKDKTVTVEKIVGLYSSRDRGMSEPGYQSARTVARSYRFDGILSLHARAWLALWDEFDFELDSSSNHATALKLRVHVFHLLQTVSPHTLATDAGVPARGWHGEAYRGHVFWDEIFILPLLNLRMPLLTKTLLRYRYRRLPEARQAAREAGFRGAMFPWQSGSDGREESQRLHLNPRSGRWNPDLTYLQRHISASIAYCVWQYFEVTGNPEFMTLYGAELFLEIVRFWASRASYNAAEDRYEIRGVMGPDEFHTAYPGREDVEPGLNNNAYTNVMAAWVLARASDLLERLSPHRCREVIRRLNITEDELELWDTISRRLKVAFHDDGVISQFEGYDDLEELDWAAYRAKYGDIQRLDRILESEGKSPNQYKLSKQADVLMLFYLFSAEELTSIFERLGYAFDPKWIPRNVEYYVKRTSDGSTLSYIVRSWVEARSNRKGSWEHFLTALSADVEDIQGGTTAEGIHLGAMAGTVDILHRCYTGFETRGDVLHFAPSLPHDIDRLSVTIRYRGQRIVVTIDHETLTLESMPLQAPPITVCHARKLRTLEPGGRLSYAIAPTGTTN